MPDVILMTRCAQFSYNNICIYAKASLELKFVAFSPAPDNWLKVKFKYLQNS